jgi:hypothetical protein
MDKGIRATCNFKFMELLPQRAALGNTAFRAAVMNHIVEEFGIPVTSAATHYNHSFQKCREASPELVEGLGRAEHKKGGRKPKAVAREFVDADGVQTEFTVKRCSDGATIAQTLTFEDARCMVRKAVAQKKAKLYWV